jgi:hypothetical protein
MTPSRTFSSPAGSQCASLPRPAGAIAAGPTLAIVPEGSASAAQFLLVAPGTDPPNWEEPVPLNDVPLPAEPFGPDE